MRRVTHREAVFGPVIHSIIDAWHYEVLWTCALTRLLWYTCDYGCLILYIMLHSIKLPTALHCMLPNTLWSTLLTAIDCTLPACLTYAPNSALKMLPSALLGMLSRTLSIAPNGTLPVCMTICSQVSSHNNLKHTPDHAFKYTPSCTRWHTPSLLDCTFRSKLSRRSQSHSRARFEVPAQSHLTIWSHICSCVLDPETCWVAGARRWVAGVGWRVVYGGRTHDFGRCCSLNLIFSVPTARRSHNASWSWCWQLPLDSAGKVDNWILGRADLWLTFSSWICCLLPMHCGGMCAHLGRGWWWWWRWWWWRWWYCRWWWW